ncbi:MAG: c-type cytochrome [Verrucomicrobiota bacterium]
MSPTSPEDQRFKIPGFTIAPSTLRIATGLIAVCLGLTATAQEFKSPNLTPEGTLKPLSVEESMKLIEVPKGFKIELVASEPMVQEPVCFAFDPDGALFVCEWLTYMQDQYGTDQFEPQSRVVKLVDTDGDGKMDKRTVFANSLMLPRSIIALHDLVLVRMSNDSTIWAFYDEDKDGIAERKEVAVKGNSVGGNIEHQDNALLWNADNRIYETGRMLRFKDGKLHAERDIQRYGQWGLARDDVGRIFASHNNHPIKDWLCLGGYPPVDPPSDSAVKKANFICEVDDATDPGREVTATGGQSMLRSTQFGPWYGSYVIPDPVRRMVKILSFEEKNGLPKSIPHPDFKDTEFIRSSDTYFRPVWTDMGPDGGLYIADMSRGIVQEASWFPTERTKNPKPAWLARYYRTKGWDMLGVNRRGRIYRLVPENKNLLDPRPQFSKKSSAELIQYLGHRNGWWRDTAHKLIVCREDAAVVPALRTALKEGNGFARMLAMRSLQAFGSLTPAEVGIALKDKDEKVRTTAIAVAETMLAEEPRLESLLAGLVQDASSTVLSQLHVTLKRIHTPLAAKTLTNLVAKNPQNGSIALLQKAGQKLPGHLEKYRQGYTLYAGLCTECHGDGENGLKTDGALMAPLFAKNERMKNGEYLVRAMLKGLQGPLGDGEIYSAGIMPPLEGLYKDDQIAAIANYIGFRWGKWQDPLKPEDVAKLRSESKTRLAPYTYEELKEAKQP